ncbi:MAG: ParB N-terminal domain-containing protein [Rhodospirillales bacterium]|nr:ParB N-terminal domain-containing protein [Rhodospirillales bacterium]
MGIIRVSLSELDRSERLRAIDPDWVKSIAASIIDQCGPEGDLNTPIIVSQKRKDGKRWLLAGDHRADAYCLLNRFDIPAIQKTTLVGNNERARNARLLIKIDENLFRHELNPLDKAVSLLKRKEIYEALHPETKRGGNKGNQHTGGKSQLTDILSFSQDAANKTGLNERSIRRSVMIAKNLSPETQARIAGTEFALKQKNLLDLAQHGPEKQSQVLDMVFANDNPAPSVAAAVKVIDGKVERIKTPEEKIYEKLVDSWSRANAGTKEQFIQFLIKDGAIKHEWPQLAEE